MSLLAGETEKTRSTRHRQKFEGHTKLVLGVIHLPGGQRIMTCSDDGSLRVWNLESGEQVGDGWRDGESGVFTIALSPDGKKIASGSRDGWVRFWDIDTGKLIIRWMAHTNIISSLCWSRDGWRVLTVSCDGTVKVWNVESRETILEIEIELNSTWQPAAIYSADETMIATSAQFLKIWDAKKGKLIKNLKEREVACLAWTADGSTLFSGSFTGSITTWDTTTWQQTHVLTGHTSVVEAIAISPNGRILASASQDNTARLWNLDNGQPIGLPIHHADLLFCVSFSADGKLLASGCGPGDHSAYTWDISAIVTEAGLDELLSNSDDGGKPLLDAHATRRPRRQSENRYTYRLPPRFLDDSPYHPDPSGRRVSPPSAPPHHITRNLSSHQGRLLDRVSSLFRHSHDDSHGMVSPSMVFDVPFAKGKRRNISGAEKRLEKEKAKRKKASGGSSRPPQSSVSQQSGGAPQAHTSSQHHTVSTSSAVPAVTAASASTTTSRPDIMITQAGRWTRFRLFICCVSATHSDGHH